MTLSGGGKVALFGGTLGRAAVVKDLATGVSMHLSPHQDSESKHSGC